MKSLWRRLGVVFCFCAVLSAAAGCSREQQKPQAGQEHRKAGADATSSAENQVVSVTTVLATIKDSQKAYLADGAGQPYYSIYFNERGRGVAFTAQVGYALRVVHNEKAGRPLENFDAMAISPDGARIAYSAQIGDRWGMVIDDKKGVPSEEATNPVFSPDSRHIAYYARTGQKWHVVVDDRTGPAGFSLQGDPVFSADSGRVLYVENTKDENVKHLVVSDLSFQHVAVRKISNNQMAVNKDKTRAAAIVPSRGKQRVIEFSIAQPDSASEGSSYDMINKLAFGPDGVSVSYAAERGGKRYLVLNSREEPLPDGEIAGLPGISPDSKGVGLLLSSKDGFFLHQAFYSQRTQENYYDEAADLVYSNDGSLHAYAARKGDAWFAVLNGKNGPAFDRVVMPVFSPDGKFLVYRARKNGKRFVVVADVNGKGIVRHRAYDEVHQPVFTPDGKSVAYGVKDGNKLIWKVEKLPGGGAH